MSLLPATVVQAVTGAHSTSELRRVPNQFPVLCSTYRLAIIGDAPSTEDVHSGRPFQGSVGRFMYALLKAHGMDKNHVFLGNVCQFQPSFGSDLNSFIWTGPEIQSSLAQLRSDIALYKPNCILLLGKHAMRAAWDSYRSLGDLRGSMYKCTEVESPFYGYKFLATYHPNEVMKLYDRAPLFRFDLSRARQQAESSDLVMLERKLLTGLSINQIIEKVTAITDGKYPDFQWCSYDLEGYWNRITRFSFATSPTEGFIVPITKGEYDSYWTVEDEGRIWVAVARCLQSPHVRKVLQNSLYDRFVLAWKYNILISNVWWDTMLGHFELFCELPKSLGLQASIYTNEPFWKEDRDNEDLTIRELYCCKDSAVTGEIANLQLELMPPGSPRDHFQFNMDLLNPMLFMELRGMKYDTESAAKAKIGALVELWELKHRLNMLAGKIFIGSKDDLLEIARNTICKKRERDYVMLFAHLPHAALKAQIPFAERLAQMEKDGAFAGEMSNATLGELESILGIELNVDSPKQMNDWIYVQRKFDRQYKKDSKGCDVLTSDVNACLTLYRKSGDPVFKIILQIRALLYKVEVLGITVDPDGRIRCGYNLVGAETCRVACYASPTGSGYNLQTVTKKLRYLILADEDHWFFQNDLAGADGWTVAAHCMRLGDATMFDDYKFGLKPARIIAQMYLTIEAEVAKYKTSRGHEPSNSDMYVIMNDVTEYVNSLSRSDLKTMGKMVDPDGWLYFGSKRVQHGSNYGSKEYTVSNIILKDSYKFLGEPIYVEPKTCARLQHLYHARYLGIKRWHAWVGNQLVAHEKLTAASGSSRRFFGRIRDGSEICQETLRAALSHEPQHNTTYATNRALLKLWSDVDNRDTGRLSGLVIEPLHQVHDAMLGQFPKSETEWAVKKLREYMDNPMTIAGYTFNIPYEGAYGRSWGELDRGTI